MDEPDGNKAVDDTRSATDSTEDSVADPATHPFDRLTPDLILDAMESQGYIIDGRLFPLNSYENRVYQIGIEGEQPLIGKFYRPSRWSREQIIEEHQFGYELAEQELPVVVPLMDDSGQSLFEFKGFQLSEG